MIFQTYDPTHVRLRQYINCYWYIVQNQDEVTSIDPKMIPDGHYHMVFNLGSPHRFIDKEGSIFSPKVSHLNANQKDYLKINRTGAVEIIGVIFKPYGLFRLLNFPIHEVSKSVWNVEDLIGHHINEIEERLFNATKIENKISLLEAWLLNLMNLDAPLEYEKIVEFVVKLLMMRKGLIKINQVLDQIHVTERSLERHFKHVTGLTPKQFAGICRIQHVLRTMRLTETNISNYAIQGGFYDQSQFIHVFKRLTGITPLSYVQSRNHLSDLYNTK